MKVVILCGGQGERIRSIARDLPKPLVPIVGQPILWHIMNQFAKFNYKHFILCLGYQGYMIKEYFLSYETRTSDFTIRLDGSSGIVYHRNLKKDWDVVCADTGLNSLTGTRLKRIEQYIGDDPDFILTYGDGVANVNLPVLVEFHRAHGKVMTITGVRPPGRFGHIVEGPNGRVLEFHEKTQPKHSRISGGFFVCSRSIFDYISLGHNVSLEQQTMRRLAADGELMLYKHDGFWRCMDTPDDHRVLTELCRNGVIPWDDGDSSSVDSTTIRVAPAHSDDVNLHESPRDFSDNTNGVVRNAFDQPGEKHG